MNPFYQEADLIARALLPDVTRVANLVPTAIIILDDAAAIGQLHDSTDPPAILPAVSVPDDHHLCVNCLYDKRVEAVEDCKTCGGQGVGATTQCWECGK